ncbi:hypothetical protein [Pseudomonas sp. DC3000-4b1]|uniref:hypothetical protein n=1 Tax=unclassified Pseudomonas TaxID=196821 RepID=UPI003CF9397E
MAGIIERPIKRHDQQVQLQHLSAGIKPIRPRSKSRWPQRCLATPTSSSANLNHAQRDQHESLRLVLDHEAYADISRKSMQAALGEGLNVRARKTLRYSAHSGNRNFKFQTAALS